MADEKEILPDFRPHRGTEEHPGGQVRAIEGAMAYRTMTCVWGRSSGKTATLPFLFIEEGRATEGLYEFVYCAPTQRLAREQFRRWLRIFQPFLDTTRGFDKGCSVQDLILHVQPFGTNAGANATFWGLDEYDNLRGPRANRIAVDECKDVHPDAVRNVLRPMLLGREGKILFIGTPARVGKGVAWFKVEYMKGLSPDHPSHYALNFPSHCNPWLTAKDLRDIAEDVDDEKAYREEILAEFLDSEYAVFENLEHVFVLPATEISKNEWKYDEPPPPDDVHPYRYIMGFDPARSIHGDFAVLTVFNTTTHDQVHLFRMKGLPLPEQIDHLHRLRNLYNQATIHFDANGMGVAMRDDLARTFKEGAVPHTWNARTKEQDVSNGRILCSRENWRLIDCPYQRTEFETFQIVTETAGGNRLNTPRYEASPGLHDDSVTAALILSSSLMHSAPLRRKAKKKEPPFSGQWFRQRRQQRKLRRALNQRTGF